MHAMRSDVKKVRDAIQKMAQSVKSFPGKHEDKFRSPAAIKS